MAWGALLWEVEGALDSTDVVLDFADAVLDFAEELVDAERGLGRLDGGEGGRTGDVPFNVTEIGIGRAVLVDLEGEGTLVDFVEEGTAVEDALDTAVGLGAGAGTTVREDLVDETGAIDVRVGLVGEAGVVRRGGSFFVKPAVRV